MALKRSKAPEGTLVVLEHTSRVLQGNPLGDPHVRKLGVWLPAEYDQRAGRGPGKRFPTLWDLVGFTGSGLAHANWKPFSDNVPERVARLIHERLAEHLKTTAYADDQHTASRRGDDGVGHAAGAQPA